MEKQLDRDSAKNLNFFIIILSSTTAEHARGPASTASGTAQPTTANYSIQFAT